MIALLAPDDGGTQGAQAICRGFNVPVGLGAENVRGGIRQCRTDQIPVGHGFGGDHRDPSTELMGLDGNVHIKDLPV